MSMFSGFGNFKQLEKLLSERTKELEAASKVNAAFLTIMSHDIRTQLNVVVGISSLRMEDENLPAPVREDIQKIHNASKLLLGIVDDVLDVSKIETGKLELSTVDYDTASLLNDIITFNMAHIENKPVQFNVDISDELPCTLHGDDLRIKQIFNNLLSNAFKYITKGAVTLQVSVTREDSKDVWLSISVSDTGIGIREEDLKDLFNEHNHADALASRKIEGAGLGLSITKNLVQLMDGDIFAKSQYGEGATFNIKIRQGFVSNDRLGVQVVENLRNFCYKSANPHGSAKLIRPDLSHARVLVVDDFSTNLDVAAKMLHKYKLQVDCVTNGKEAFNRIKYRQPVYDAVFMDHMMPGMDGIEATRLIRGLDTKYTLTLPIIALTANVIFGSEKLFLENGFNEVMSKPIDTMKLDSVIRKWLLNKTQDKSVLIEISGINMESGLALYNGKADEYLSALRSYVNNTPKMIENMHDVSEENLLDYAINIHGLKNFSASIGAEDICERAKNLEAIAKKGNLAGVLAESENLLKDVDTLVNDIQSWLEKNPS